jgi:hypothetical protein
VLRKAFSRFARASISMCIACDRKRR